MLMKRNICVITGGRMDYGHLYLLLKEIKNNDNLDLYIITTCMHLSPEFGLTYKKIISDGFKIYKNIECLLSSDTSVGVAKSVGLATIGFADALSELNPHIVLLLGDRFELLAAAQASLFLKIPIAHISGGDTTEGAYDESIRHSITKMAHLHFVTNKDSFLRVRQLGENPKKIFNVGSPSIDLIKSTIYLNKHELEKRLNIKFRKYNFLITYHPATLEIENSMIEISNLLDSLKTYGEEYCFIFTKSNADDGGRKINELITKHVIENKNNYLFDSLGQQIYYSLIKVSNGVIGNSSSGITEVPTFGKATINIGNRQKGRLAASSVITIEAKKEQIKAAIKNILMSDFSKTVSPYGQGNTSKKIVEILENIKIDKNNLQKKFFDLEINENI